MTPTRLHPRMRSDITHGESIKQTGKKKKSILLSLNVTYNKKKKMYSISVESGKEQMRQTTQMEQYRSSKSK